MGYIETKLRKIGNSKGVIIPAEMLAALGLDENSSVFITKTTGGITINAGNPELQMQLDVAAKGMKKYRNALSALAK